MQEASGIRTAGRASFHHFLTSIGLCCKNDLLRISASQVYRCVDGVSMCISELYVLHAWIRSPPPDAHKGHPYIWVYPHPNPTCLTAVATYRVGWAGVE